MRTCTESPKIKPVRVLVIEDNVDDSDLLVRRLTKIDFDGAIKVIPDGAQAWNVLIAKDSCAELIAIFIDLKLPSLNGLKLLGRIKLRPELSTIPIFIMTSSNDSKDLEECTRLGVDGDLTKPVGYMAFAKAVERHLFRDRLPLRNVKVK